MKIVRLKNFRRGYATNSSSTHSIIYRNENELFEDLNIFELNYYGRFDNTIAASKEAKIKYIFSQIWRNDDLVRRMATEYPEIKEYYYLAKAQYEQYQLPYTEQDDEILGSYPRGSIATYDKNVSKEHAKNFSFDYLKYIIETPDIIIIGGSDEEDFVYDTCEGHKEAPTVDDVELQWSNIAGKKNIVTKNGNYYVAYGNTWEEHHYDGEIKEFPFKYSTGARLRYMTEEGEPIPEHPELIDLHITNRCNHGCKFCFMDSRMNQPDANIDELTFLAKRLEVPTEFSIGGGNILLYPNLKELFVALNENKHIVNTTINVKDCDTIINDGKLLKLFKDYVDGIGVSVFSKDDIETFERFRQAFDKVGDYNDNSGRNTKYITMHIVPEYIGYTKTMEILSEYRKGRRFNILFLGYKTNGRGASCTHETFTEQQIFSLFKGVHSIAIDTSFAKKYGKYIKKTFNTKFTLTENEGEYSMYIDGVTMNAYKSSYETDKPYFVGADFNREWSERRKGIQIQEAFAKIREDNGFPAFKEKHYWEENTKKNGESVAYITE